MHRCSNVILPVESEYLAVEFCHTSGKRVFSRSSPVRIVAGHTKNSNT